MNCDVERKSLLEEKARLEKFTWEEFKAKEYLNDMEEPDEEMEKIKQDKTKFDVYVGH